MSATTTPTPSAVHRRQRALDPYVERLRNAVGECCLTDASGRILIDGRPVEVAPWSPAEVRKALANPDDSETASVLLLQTIAIRLKIAQDRARLERPTSQTTEIYVAQAELMLDTAVSLALTREIQPLIDEAVRRGLMGEAKRWTGLKNALHHTASELKRMLADSERGRADAITDSLTDRPREEQGSQRDYAPVTRQPAAAGSGSKRSRHMKRRAMEAIVRLPSRTEMLTASLAISVAVWLGFVKVPELLASEPVRLTLSDFPHSEGILLVDAHPPSLYLTVDSSVWSGLSRDDRLDLAKSVSSVLLTSDYTGALLRTDDGRPVAQWLIGTGVRLLDADRKHTAPRDAP